jgi:hypothetical protein
MGRTERILLALICALTLLLLLFYRLCLVVSSGDRWWRHPPSSSSSINNNRISLPYHLRFIPINRANTHTHHTLHYGPEGALCIDALTPGNTLQTRMYQLGYRLVWSGLTIVRRYQEARR